MIIPVDAPSAFDIRTARLNSKIALPQIAALAEVSPRTWQRWEAGVPAISGTDWSRLQYRLSRLVAILKVKPRGAVGRPRTSADPTCPSPAMIHASRLEARWSQKEAARLIGVSMRTWVRWENGETGMPSDAWERWQGQAAGGRNIREPLRRGRPAVVRNPNAPDALHIRATRKAARISQNEAALLADVSRRTWQRWEAGVTFMPTNVWEIWCTALSSRPVGRIVGQDLRALAFQY
jgi:transcriptional regulator with XRE-family HTH domain